MVRCTIGTSTQPTSCKLASSSVVSLAQSIEEKAKKLEQDKLQLQKPMQKKSSGGFGRWVARGTALFVGGVAIAVSGGT
jgi:hypothetical protein